MVQCRGSRSNAAAASARRPADGRDLGRLSPGAHPGGGAARRTRARTGAAAMSANGLTPSRGLLAADPKGDFDAGPPRISFEFFPPKTPEMEERLWEVIKRVEPLGPRFVSVTYGAGGSTRERTHATVRRIRQETCLEPAAHLTCVGASREEIDAVARDYWEAGIRHIVALRGDPPAGASGYQPHPAG